MDQKRIEEETRRLHLRPPEGALPGGIGTSRFVVRCEKGQAEMVLERAREVMDIVGTNSFPSWPAEEEWRGLLPQWFTSACVIMSDEEIKREIEVQRGMTWEERAKRSAELKWMLNSWLEWLKPAERQWLWWDAQAIPEIDCILIAVEVDGWPFPWGALEWLFQAAGAISVESEEEF